MNARLRFVLYVFLAAAVLGVVVRPASGQEQPNITDFIDPATTYHTSGFDYVDVIEGRVALDIPLIVDHSQRGNLNFTYSLRYASSTTWYLDMYPCGNSWCYQWAPANGAINSPHFSMDGRLAFGTDYASNCCILANYARDDNGSAHYLGTTSGYQYELFDRSFVAESADGSGIRAEVNASGGNGTVTFFNRQGMRFYQTVSGWTPMPVSQIEDPNGNLLTFSCFPDNWCAQPYTQYMTDTVGRVWAYYKGDSDVSGCPVPAVASDIWDTPGVSGGTRRFKLCYSNIPISTQFNNGWASEYNSTQQLMTGVVLPDGTFWQFDYDNWGVVVTVHLPTGGLVTYNWTTLDDQRVLQSRSQFDGSHSFTSYYSEALYPSVTATVTDPANNDSVYTPLNPNNVACDERLSSVQYYSGTGGSRTLLKTDSPGYQVLDNPYPTDVDGCTVTYLPASTSTTWPNNVVDSTALSHDPGFSFTEDKDGSTHSGVYGLVTSEKYYDYGSGAPGTLLTQKYTWYMATEYGGSYLSGNLLDLVAQQSTYGNAGNCCFVTYYFYDGSPTVSSGVTVQLTSPPNAVMGNLTSIVQWDSTTNSNVTTSTYTNYDTGMRATSADALNHTTTYNYANQNPNWYGSRLTSVTNALGQTVNYAYDWPSGLINWFQDLNGNWTQYIFDNMFRPTQITYPDAGQTNFTYSSYNGFMYSLEQRKIDNNSHWTSFYTQYDGLGRPFRTATGNGESNPDNQVDTCYDARGNVGFTSYPYQNTGFNTSPVCSGAGDGYIYDALNRVTGIAHPDSGINISYSGRATSVSDEGNNAYWVQRISQADALGRVTSVCEVSSDTQLGTGQTPTACGQDIAATGFLTTYTYDALNSLVTVSQGGYRNRSFTYDSRDRLTSASNPESGSTSYVYDQDPNCPAPNSFQSLLVSRTDARGVRTCMEYDVLNRLTSKVYSDGTPTAGYAYDFSQTWGLTLTNTVGRLAEIYTYSAAQGYTAALSSYDAMGRVSYEYTCLPIACWSNSGGNFVPGQGYATLAYGYDYVGDMVSSTNGEGVTLSYSYNSAQLLTGITSSLNDTNHPSTLLSAAHYNAAGALTSATLDNGLINESRGYDGRMRLSSISNTALGNGLYGLAIGYSLDSNVWTVTDSVNGLWTYGFDSFNRLNAANGPNQGYTYAYDRFGNRWHQDGPATMDLTFTGNSNRMDPGTAGYTYDAAGNLTNDGTTTYTYDGENRVISAHNQSNGTTTYVYDGDGRRVRKTAAGVVTDYLYDVNGAQVGAVNGSGSWLRGEVYAAGRHFATYSGGTSGTTLFNFADHLGTERVRATVGGTVCETITSLPFGDGMTINGSCGDPSPMHFTGQERDGETGNDNFKARYYGSSLGRFMTPDGSSDPDPVPYADLTDPQTLNLYSYVRNNPLRFIDPDGHIKACVITEGADDDGNPTQNETCTNYPDDPDPLGSPLGGDLFLGEDGNLPLSNFPAAGPSAPSSNPVTGNRGNCVAGFTAGGAIVGDIGGAILGGGAGGFGGTLVAPGVGTIGGGIAGVETGAATGTLAGAAAGAALGSIICSQGSGGGGGSRGGGGSSKAREQESIRAVAKEAGIDRRQFGDYVEKVKPFEGRGPNDNFTFDELRRLAQEFKAGNR